MEAAAYVWQLIGYAFPFRDPAAFPVIESPVLTSNMEILEHYCDEAVELAESQLLKGETEINVSFTDGRVPRNS
jgi:hypothetical protein